MKSGSLLNQAAAPGLIGQTAREQLSEGEQLLHEARCRAARIELEEAEADLPGRQSASEEARASLMAAHQAYHRAKQAETSTYVKDPDKPHSTRLQEDPEVSRTRKERNVAGHAYEVAKFALQQAEQRLRDARKWLRRVELGFSDPQVGKVIAVFPLDATGQLAGGRPGDWNKPGHEPVKIPAVAFEPLPKLSTPRVSKLVYFQRKDGQSYKLTREEAEAAAGAGLGKIVQR